MEYEISLFCAMLHLLLLLCVACIDVNFSTVFNDVSTKREEDKNNSRLFFSMFGV